VKLEAAIIEAAKERYGYTDREQLARLDNGRGIGGHPDRRVMCPRRGPGIIETKMVDWLERKKWGDEPPLHYLLQNQSYQGLDQVEWGDVVVLVGGNKLERFEYPFRPVIYADIEARVANFWQSVRENKPPKPEYARDRDTLAEVWSDPADVLIDMRHDNRMPVLACEYLEACEAKRSAETRVDELQGEILAKLGDATRAMVDGYSVKVPVIAGAADREITADMVGTIIKGRKSHRRFYVKEIA
jgi:predicted phage-related endonuclease